MLEGGGRGVAGRARPRPLDQALVEPFGHRTTRHRLDAVLAQQRKILKHAMPAACVGLAVEKKEQNSHPRALSRTLGRCGARAFWTEAVRISCSVRGWCDLCAHTNKPAAVAALVHGPVRELLQSCFIH